MHTRAHSASAETAESCGTTLSVVGTVLLPCAQITLTAHGNPTATHHAHRKSPSFQQKPVPTPQRPQSPMCSIDNNHAHQAPPRRRPTNPPQTRAGTRPISTRTTTDLAAKMYRSRRGTGPISPRNWTDLGTGYDRSRRGAQPAPGRREGDSNPRCARRTAVFKTATFGRSVISPCPHNHSNYSMLVRATRHYHHRPEAQRHCPCPRGQTASAASATEAESTASATPTGVNRGRRTPACESVWPTPAPARRACPGVPPPRPAPSPATRADGA